MKYYCNPMNLEYAYQFQRYKRGPEEYTVFREAADPSMVCFQGIYYLFPSMTGGFFTSEDMAEWQFHPFLSEMPVYDYAPDVSVSGEYLYFCASRDDKDCSFFRTKDPLTQPFEEIPGTFPFWDPNLFWDEDGRVYFYWGCSNVKPIYGIELDPATMKPLCEPRVMIDSCREKRGYERNGEDHMMAVNEEEQQEQIEAAVAMMMGLPKAQREKMGYGVTEEELREKFSGIMSDRPYIEGAWMTKYKGRYYLQYAIPGTENNVYGDGCYVGESPLGPFVPAKNNPYSYMPGGFITGAGHGSTLIDKQKRVWHAASMRIIENYRFERRLGLWKAGFDTEGELYCDQTYGDWPVNIEKPPFAEPDFMLLSYKKKVSCSSGQGQEYVTDEDIRTHWRAGSSQPGEWVEIDLGAVCDVRAIQINFAENQVRAAALPENSIPMESAYEIRYIDPVKQRTRWQLTASIDGKQYVNVEDKREAESDLPHDLVVKEEGFHARFLRLTIQELPYGQVPAVSGFRVFGYGDGMPPAAVRKVQIQKVSELDVELSWEEVGAVGYNILWGYQPDKLYHSRLVYGQNHVKIGAFIKGEAAYGRIDAFNENGIARGSVFLLYE